MRGLDETSKRNRILAAALGFVATTGACGVFGTFATFENRALFGEETSSAANRRQIVAQAKNGALESPSGRKAFLVGADDYADALDLVCVKNDVEALAARLIEIGFKPENVTVLKTGGSFEDFPTKANIESRFAAFLETLAPGDFVVVYLSGHGIQPTGSKESFFAPIDVKSSDPFGTAVSIDAMTTELGESDAKFRWLIVDACRNDPTNAKAIFKTRAAGAKGLVDPVRAPDSLWVLQSCAPGKFSYEGGSGVGNGVFTLSLLEALDKSDPKADANGDGSLAITEILSYVTKRTNELAFEHHGASQVPRWSGAEMTEFAVLDDLLVEGLTRAKWLEADALYQEACVLRRKREYRKAAEKLALARKINAVNEEYKAEEELIAELLANQTALQEAQKTAQEAARKAEEEAAARAEAERKAEEEAAARAEAERKAEEETAGARGDAAILEKARKLREASVSAAKCQDWETAVSKMEASLALVESKSSRELLKKYQAERNRATPTAPTSLPFGFPPPMEEGESEGGPPPTGGPRSDYEPPPAGRLGSDGGRFGGGERREEKDEGVEVAWNSNPKAGTAKTLTIKGETYTFHYCPAGSFTMGSPTSESGRGSDETQHEVTLTNGFWMLETEVTQAMWKSVMGANPSYFDSSERNPVERVSWNDCQDFIGKLNSLGGAPPGFKFRLSTEAEWEYACRAGTTSPYFWGASLNGDKANCDGDYPYGTSTKGEDLGRTTKVGSYDANPWGLYDMHGNVWEWCEDLYTVYDNTISKQGVVNVTKESGRVLRGGSWGGGAKNCRSAGRGCYAPSCRIHNFGFRLVLVREL